MNTALVTGASGGIGLAITRRLAAAGVQVTLVARRIEKLHGIISSLPGSGHNAIQADLSAKAGIQAVAAHLRDHRYDVLINNAGVGLYGRFEEIDLEAQRKMLALNIDALVELSHAYLQHAQQGDALVNVASVLGFASFPGSAAYAATKGFVVQFSRSLWHEWRKRGVFILGFCPGVTSSEFHESAGGERDRYPAIMVQTPDQVARVVMKALKRRRKPIVLPGFINNALLFSQRFISLKMGTNIMGLFSPAK